MSFSKEVKEELKNLKIWDVRSNFTQEEQLNRIIVREAFINSGSITNPNKEYHLEITEKNKNKIQKLLQILEESNISVKQIKREKYYILYIKDGEEISKFLAFIGAKNSVLKFEDTRVLKETKNVINRRINCETANLNKTINASIIQIENIKLLKRIKKFEKLPDNLKEIANLRLKNPEASLVELGQMLKNPIGKSGVNHRLKKIEEIANEYKKI